MRGAADDEGRGPVAGAMASVASALLVLSYEGGIEFVGAGLLIPELELMARVLVCLKGSLVVGLTAQLRSAAAGTAAALWNIVSLIGWVAVVSARFEIDSLDVRAGWLITSIGIFPGGVLLP